MKEVNVEKHFLHLKKLLAFEEEEEIEQFRLSFLEKTPEERQKAGKALLRLKVHEFHFTPAGHELASFKYADSRDFPIYSPDIGDPVTLIESSGETPDPPFGTVYEKDAQIITVAFNRALPDWVNEDGLYDLNIGGSRATYKKMNETLDFLLKAEHSRPAFFRDVSLGLKRPESYDPLPVEKISFLNPGLNPWQKAAVAMGLASRDVALVHGPPGTGKTTALIEIIRQTIAMGQFVFASAPSNTACDHLLECLVGAGVPAVRLGHPARIMKHLRGHTLDFKLAAHPYAKSVDEMETRIHLLHVRAERKRDRGGLTRDERQEIADEVKQLKQEIRELDRKILAQVVDQAPVMVGTLTSATDPVLRGKPFDLLVMDEASQAIEPAAWIPILKAQRVIFAGDHFQLPPTVRSKKAEEGGLEKTLFERLNLLAGDERTTLLRIQYRMHEKIMNFSSREFYEGKLIADDSVKNHTLADLPHVRRAPETEEPFLFLDTAGRGFEEALEPGSESRFNAEEAEMVLSHLKRLLELGVKPEEIAVISPYSAQVRLLTSRSPDPGIEVDSVDGFQGREKELVILSLVRSNIEGELGFLADTRRMNVAMTRAKRKLVVIGDSATLSSIPFYKRFIEYAESIGAYRSSWEEMI